MCSTPFGINERTTARARPPSSSADVLNAFRHQRKNHLIREAVFAQRAVVLNAFRHQRKNHQTLRGYFRGLSMCSTPFGINERTTIEAGRRCPSLEVCSTPFGINERTTTAMETWKLSACWCSTPFGINERTTQPRRHGAGERDQVLNAFRHQRKNHLGGVQQHGKRWFGAQRLSASTKEPLRVWLTILVLGIVCSTPFGINERTT